MTGQTPYYVEWFGIPPLTAQDVDLLQTVTQYLVALIAFLLITIPATARAKVQSHIERSRLSQEITQAFEANYRKDGTVLSGTGRSIVEYDLLSVLNNATLWLRVAPSDPKAPLLERGERYRKFVEQSNAGLNEARISIDHLQLVAGIFRRIGVGLDTKTLRRRDLNTVWNYVVVWTYDHRLDFLSQTLGVSRREFTRVIGSICRTYPLYVWKHPCPGKDYFDFIFEHNRDAQLTNIGWRPQWRLRFVGLYRRQTSAPARITLKAVDSLLRLCRVF